LGCRFQFAVQEKPAGIAEAFLIGESFIGGDKVALILGDNIFYGSGLSSQLQANNDPDGGIIYAYHVQNPGRYGVVTLNDSGDILSLEEKPANPRSNYAIPGIYFYDERVVEYARAIRPSKRGELEITDINNAYLQAGKLNVSILDRGTAWLDTGTFQSLMQAAQFVQVIEERQGLKIGAIEEVAFQMGYIGKAQLRKLAEPLCNSGYGEYLLRLIEETETR
jgi:glucose-1-phosphate thymidylyltransferase